MLQAGTWNGNYRPVIDADPSQGTLIVDPRATLIGAPIYGFANRTTKELSSLSVDYSFLGGVSTIEVTGRRNAVAAVFLSVERAPISIPGLGSWWLDSNAALFLGSSSLGAFTGRATIRLQHLTDARLRGLEVGYQGLTFDGKTLELTNPVLQVVR